jgi:hypothetical protein
MKRPDHIRALKFILASFAVLCGVLLFLHIYDSSLQIDSITLSLATLILFSLIFPILLPFLKKFKFGNIEIELDIQKFGKQVERAQRQLESSGRTIPAKIPKLKLKILEEASDNPENAILILCNQMEIITRGKLKPELADKLSLGESIKKAVKQGTLSADCQSAYERWWSLKEKVISLNFQVSKGTMITMISYGLDLLFLLASEDKK